MQDPERDFVVSVLNQHVYQVAKDAETAA